MIEEAKGILTPFASSLILLPLLLLSMKIHLLHSFVAPALVGQDRRSARGMFLRKRRDDGKSRKNLSTRHACRRQKSRSNESRNECRTQGSYELLERLSAPSIHMTVMKIKSSSRIRTITTIAQMG